MNLPNLIVPPQPVFTDPLSLIMICSDIGIDDCRELRDILGALVADVLPTLLPCSQSKSHEEQQLIGGVPVQLVRGGGLGGCHLLMFS